MLIDIFPRNTVGTLRKEVCNTSGMPTMLSSSFADYQLTSSELSVEEPVPSVISDIFSPQELLLPRLSWSFFSNVTLLVKF